MKRRYFIIAMVSLFGFTVSACASSLVSTPTILPTLDKTIPWSSPFNDLDFLKNMFLTFPNAECNDTSNGWHCEQNHLSQSGKWAVTYKHSTDGNTVQYESVGTGLSKADLESMITITMMNIGNETIRNLTTEWIYDSGIAASEATDGAIVANLIENLYIAVSANDNGIALTFCSGDMCNFDT